MEKLKLKNSVLAAIENGDRLLDDAKTMLDWESFPTSYALAVLAQEEYAKVLLLKLIAAGAITWSDDVRRALKDHVCKQLVSVILDYLSPDDDEWLRRHEEWKRRQDLSGIHEDRTILPPNVLDAINLICQERIPRERDRWWIDPSEPPIDKTVKAIADGRLEGHKQDAIYVRLGKTGEVVSRPSTVSADVAKDEVERSERIGSELRPYSREPWLSNTNLDHEKLIGIFKLLSGNISPEDFTAYWWVS